MSDQNPQQPQYRDDEIDLRKLFQAIGNFFIKIGRNIIGLIISIRRITLHYKYLLIASIILGMIAGFSMNRVFKPIYKTSLMLKSGYLDTKMVENSIDKLNLLCEEEDRIGLAKVLGVGEEVALNIVEFDFEFFVDENDIIESELLKQRLADLETDQLDIDKIIEQIELVNRHTFKIFVKVHDIEIIENLQETLIGYFKNNPYVLNRIKTNKTRQENLMAKLKREIASLDSLKDAYNLNLKMQAGKPSEATNNVYLGESGAVNPVTVYSQGINLYENLLDTRRSYDLGTDFELIDGFTTFSKPSSPGALKSIVILAGIFLGLGYILIILIEINKYLNRVEKEGFKALDS